MKHFLLAAVLTLTSGIAGAAGAAPAAKTTDKPATKEELVCPVTHEKIGSMGEAAGKSVYQGKTYYFCCSGCKPMFDKNPAKYVKATPAAKAPKKS